MGYIFFTCSQYIFLHVRFIPNAEVSFGNMFGPKLPFLIEKSVAQALDALYECFCEWVNVKLYCKAL